jgi:hypothetical protein
MDQSSYKESIASGLSEWQLFLKKMAIIALREQIQAVSTPTTLRVFHFWAIPNALPRCSAGIILAA